MLEPKLTDKQEAFAREYVRTSDLSAAYRFAYNTNATSKSINEAASNLARNPKIASRIKELNEVAKKVADKKFAVTAEEMLRHLNILRNSRIDEYITLTYDDEEYDEVLDVMVPCGNPICKWKPFSELTPEQLMCIESVKEGRYGIELRLHGKEWTIEKINKHIGFYEKDNEQSKAQITTKTTIKWGDKEIEV